MHKYGQYCPVAKAAEILGDRWTLLIVRDLLCGCCHFNELERGLPGIPRALLADRLRRLQQAGIVEKLKKKNGRYYTEYRLTQAGQQLQAVIEALLVWGACWAFSEPKPDDLDPVLLLWWMRGRVCVDQLPDQRVVVQFDFKGTGGKPLWLVLTKEDVSICLTHPGFETDVLVTAELTIFYQVWLGRIHFSDALKAGQIEIDAIPAFAWAFPGWFTYSPGVPAVHAAMAEKFE